MLPPEFESIAMTLKAHYRTFLLEDAERQAVPDLLAAEKQVSSFVRDVGRDLLQSYVDVRAQQARQARRPCSCGCRPPVHRTTTWRRETPFGPIIVPDPYMYCGTCHRSERPLHRLLGTDRETWSLAVQQAAVDLVADESAGKAVAKLARHHPGVEMERTTALRMLHHHGKQARRFIDNKLAAARKLAQRPPKLQRGGADELEVEWDAGMIPVATLERIEPPASEDPDASQRPAELPQPSEPRAQQPVEPPAQQQREPKQKPERTPVRNLPKRRRNCRWEEAKVGLVQKPGETDRLYSVRSTEKLDASFEDLFALACLKGWTEQTHVRGIADGAPHIRPRLEEAFHAGSFRFILDRPHGKEHLADAAEQLQAESALDEGVTAQTWAATALAKLESDGADEVVAELIAAWKASGPTPESRNDQLRREAAYFERNNDAVVYAHYRAHGWSTASSEVESAHRHVVQDRLKIAGAWWHPDHVDDVLALRMLRANGWWDEYWQTQYQAWSDRAQTFT